MIKVSVLYPNSDSATFDMDYYLNTHLPLVAELVGEALLSGHADKGLAGGAPGEAPAYIAMGHLTFDSVESFQQSFGPHQGAILADLANFTNTHPTVQISEIKQ
ncbi:EthD family reductase [Paraglaciecola polaris]|uniref:Ethyl tert-butyl ether degradation EthD n=1 Tax=Paraglaciecola polaris LMG 21857 TaxID=1129793 RepID=K6ZEL9_9ALTE|nr:EthD family reductase [Paraglaciecola polaris]GAC34536.1 ethyl tert-butyl ether degradation EthD [Paraglaciecola polaris LMG 21857]|tara:strand:- start:393 stop:704 length:312 start_codon:yes stop_codon:yes gene_type:complete